MKRIEHAVAGDHLSDTFVVVDHRDGAGIDHAHGVRSAQIVFYGGSAQYRFNDTRPA